MDEHRAWPVAHLAEHPRDGIRAAYEQLLSEAGSHATRHEVLVTVTVRCAKVRVHKRDRHDRLVSAVSALVGEVKLFAERLEGAHLLVSAPLSPAE